VLLVFCCEKDCSIVMHTINEIDCSIVMHTIYEIDCSIVMHTIDEIDCAIVIHTKQPNMYYYSQTETYIS